MTDSEKELVKKLQAEAERNDRQERPVAAALMREAITALEKCEKTGLELLTMRDAEINRLRDIAFAALNTCDPLDYKKALTDIAGDPDE